MAAPLSWCALRAGRYSEGAGRCIEARAAIWHGAWARTEEARERPEHGRVV